VTNSFVGMRDVDPELRDAARGLGFRESRTLLRVELPNAMPVVMAGIRTAGVQVVATATLAALVGWGGLGRYIVDGIANRNFVEVFAGAVLVALLAAAAEIGLAVLQYALTPAGLRSRIKQERQAAVSIQAQAEPAR
jgi:osmoprotectant transport system permease protein